MLVNLICVKVGSRLRVRIVSPGYKKEANCQFPRNLRVEGRKFTAPASDITLIKRGASYFYSVKARNVKIVESHEEFKLSEEYKNNLKVYGDSEENSDCVVCLCETPNAVFGPCGHLSCCMDCASRIHTTTNKCPMCRTKIEIVINYDDLK